MAVAAIVNNDRNCDQDSMDLTTADQELISIYGDTIHQNDGLHLHGKVDSDEEWEWQQVFKLLCTYNHLMYKPPWGAAQKQFVLLLQRGSIEEMGPRAPSCLPNSDPLQNWLNY